MCFPRWWPSWQIHQKYLLKRLYLQDLPSTVSKLIVSGVPYHLTTCTGDFNGIETTCFGQVIDWNVQFFCFQYISYSHIECYLFSHSFLSRRDFCVGVVQLMCTDFFYDTSDGNKVFGVIGFTCIPVLLSFVRWFPPPLNKKCRF